MVDLVDQLRAVIGVATDTALAGELGIERSTVAQWRRRGTLPRLYQAILDTQGARDVLSGTHARRRSIYGDGGGGWILRAALAVIPAAAFDFPELSPHNLGDYRERLILSLVPVIQQVSENDLGIPRVTTYPEYAELLAALSDPANQLLIDLALAGPMF